jgi:creatinine amidohydrolase
MVDSRAWPALPAAAVLLVPTGSFEQHGPHLPLHTDTTIATAVAEGVARALGPDAVLGPAIAYGSSGEHQSFAGTVSIGTRALRLAIVELVRSATTWAGRVVLVNGHGGNLTALRLAVELLRTEGRDAAWVPCAAPAGDAHAGHVETSLMLYLAPHTVDLSRAAVGKREPLKHLIPALVAGGVGAVSPNGVLGDPRGASAEAGAALLASMIEDATKRIRYGRPGADGSLCEVPP